MSNNLAKIIYLLTLLYYACGREHSTTSTDPRPEKSSENSTTKSPSVAAQGKIFTQDWTIDKVAINTLQKNLVPGNLIVLTAQNSSAQVKFFMSELREGSFYYPSKEGDYIIVEDFTHQLHYATAGTVSLKRDETNWFAVITFNYDSSNFLQGFFQFKL